MHEDEILSCATPPHSIPNICKLLDLKRTIAPTSAEEECSFSTFVPLCNCNLKTSRNLSQHSLSLTLSEPNLSSKYQDQQVVQNNEVDCVIEGRP